MSDRGGKTDCIQDRAAANDDHVAAAIEVCVINALEHSLDNVDVVLNVFAARDRLHVAWRMKPVGIVGAKVVDSLNQLWKRIGHALVDPELHARNLVSRRFDQVQQNVGVRTQNIVRESQSVDKRNRKWDVNNPRIGFVRHDFGAPAVAKWQAR
jgi:hypothetical protein